MTAWAPWTVEDTETLEKVQKRAVKAVSGLRSQTYEERLVELRLPSLSERRREMDMVQTSKMVNWENGEQIFERANVRRGTRATAGTDNLLKKRCLHEFRSNFFSTRVIHEWNGLPNEVNEAATAKIFKRRYRNHRAGTVTPA